MTPEVLEQWQDDFDAFHARFADLFERSESREQARKYLRGLLTEAQRKNSWQMAEAVGEPIPDRMQRLLYRVPWDADAARDRLQQFVIETFGHPEGIGVVDETGFLKKGRHSVGVGRQYTGTAGKRENSQVTAALRQMEPYFSAFHQVLNRARWSPLAVSRRLLQVLVSAFVRAGGTLEIVMDETLERRWGRKISKRGHWRDSLRSSKERSVSTSGLRWVSMALVVSLPWTNLRWALPFLSVLATTPKVSKELKRRHKTLAHLAQQLVMVVRRWLPDVPIKVIGDGAYSVIELGLTCVKQSVSLIAPLRLDTRLFAPPPHPSRIRWAVHVWWASACRSEAPCYMTRTLRGKASRSTGTGEPGA